LTKVNELFIRRQWPIIDAKDLINYGCHKAKFEDTGLIEVLSVSLMPNERKSKCPKYCHWCSVDDEFESSSESDSSSESQLICENSSDDHSSESSDDHSEENVLCFIVRCWSSMSYDNKSSIRNPATKVLFAVVDCPNSSYISSLVQSVHFRSDRGGAKPCDHHLSIMFHFAPVQVVQDERYQSWMKKLDTCYHIMVHASNHTQNLAWADPFPSSSRWSACMRTAAPKFFSSTFVESIPNSIQETAHEISVKQPWIVGEKVGSNFLLSSCETIVKLDDAFSGEKNSTYTANAVDQVKDILGIDSNALEIDDDDVGKRRYRFNDAPGVTFLGTGAAKPSKLRNCSSILLTLNDGYVLLDIGEAT